MLLAGCEIEDMLERHRSVRKIKYTKDAVLHIQERVYHEYTTDENVQPSDTRQMGKVDVLCTSADTGVTLAYGYCGARVCVCTCISVHKCVSQLGV